MNVRQIKKIARKKAKNRWEAEFENYIYLQGNHGGDFIEVHRLDEDVAYLRSGHCCVMSIDSVVPSEFLPAMIQKVMLEHNNDINSVIDWFGWDKQFTEDLKSKVRKI